MGCSSDSASVPMTLTEELEEQRRKVMFNIEENNVKIATYENEIDNYNKEIKERENELKNGYTLTDAEKNTRFNKLMELQKDRARVQRNLDSLKTYNEVMKNNLENIDKKLDELRVAQTVKGGNKLFKKIENENNSEVIGANAHNLISQRTKDDRNRAEIERMNRVYNGNDVINEEAYRRQLLGYGTKPGY